MFRPILYTCLFAALAVNASAQQQPSVALRASISRSKPDTNRILLLLRLSEYYLSQVNRSSSKNNPYLDSSVSILTDAISASDALNAIHLKNKSQCLLARTYMAQGQVLKGKKLYTDVIKTAHAANNDKDEALAWLTMAISLTRNKNNFGDIKNCLAQSKKIFSKINEPANEAAVKIELADIYFAEDKLLQAENELLEALNIYQKINYRKLYNAFYLLSAISRYGGDLGKSLLYATKCVQNAEETRDSSTPLVLFYGELALVYQELGQTDNSINWYRITLQEREKSGTKLFIYRTAGLLIRQLIKQRKAREALGIMFRLLKKFPTDNALEKAAVAQNLGYCYTALSQNKTAEKYFLEMIRQYNLADFKDEFVSIANQDIGKFYLDQGQFNSARKYLNKVFTVGDATLLSTKKETYHLLFVADSAIGNYVSAIKDFQQFKFLNDSIFNEKKSKQIEELQVQYETAKKEKRIYFLNAQNRIQESRLQTSELVRNYSIAGVLVIFAFLYYRYWLKQKSNNLLKKQQNQINQKNLSLQKLLKEKEWLVKEIHHRVKNNFHMVQGLLGTQVEYLKSEEAIRAFADSQHRIQAMSLIHQKLYQSDGMSAINMADYTYELIDYLKDSFRLGNNVQFNLQIEPVEMNFSYCIPLGLIINEAVTNAMKYAFPTNQKGMITVIFRHISRTQLELIISDNGVGLPGNFNTGNPTSMGIKLMKGLSEDIDSTFDVNNNNGTELRLCFQNAAETPDFKKLTEKISTDIS